MNNTERIALLKSIAPAEKIKALVGCQDREVLREAFKTGPNYGVVWDVISQMTPTDMLSEAVKGGGYSLAKRPDLSDEDFATLVAKASKQINGLRDLTRAADRRFWPLLTTYWKKYISASELASHYSFEIYEFFWHLLLATLPVGNDRLALVLINEENVHKLDKRTKFRVAAASRSYTQQALELAKPGGKTTRTKMVAAASQFTDGCKLK